eukprot:scaffold8446_cov630-Pinguiococcus_pyrenoidosus.AAC.1
MTRKKSARELPRPWYAGVDPNTPGILSLPLPYRSCSVEIHWIRMIFRVQSYTSLFLRCGLRPAERSPVENRACRSFILVAASGLPASPPVVNGQSVPASPPVVNGQPVGVSAAAWQNSRSYFPVQVAEEKGGGHASRLSPLAKLHVHVATPPHGQPLGRYVRSLRAFSTTTRSNQPRG